MTPVLADRLQGDMAISANFTHDLVNGASGYALLQVLAMNAPAVPCSSGVASTISGNGTGAIHLLATGTIPAGSGVPSELIAASPVELIISGGFNASYTTKSWVSVVTGVVKIQNGKVIADGLAIRPLCA